MTGEQSAVKARGAHSGMRIARRGEARVHVEAPADRVWEVVADIRRQHRWSCEATKCEWMPPADQAASGAKFRGHNRRGFRRWARENEVTEVEPGRVLSWQTLSTRFFPDSTEWRIELAPEGLGTEVRESYTVRTISRGFEIFVYWFNPKHRDRHADLEADLRRLKAFVEADAQ